MIRLIFRHITDVMTSPVSGAPSSLGGGILMERKSIGLLTLSPLVLVWEVPGEGDRERDSGLKTSYGTADGV